MNGNDFPASAAITFSCGGAVTIAVNISSTTMCQTPGRSLAANRSFSITYSDVPAGICQPQAAAAATGFQGVCVGSTRS
ncbi:hypothetical protein KME82_05135 [Lysobacter capsici]|nr:hypothetical protein KME82_05135 [Lysobacter capsici]